MPNSRTIEYLKVEDEESLWRDLKSNAIINADMDALDEYYKKKALAKDKKKKQEEEINTMKGEIKEIKEMLSVLLTKLNS